MYEILGKLFFTAATAFFLNLMVDDENKEKTTNDKLKNKSDTAYEVIDTCMYCNEGTYAFFMLKFVL